MRRPALLALAAAALIAAACGEGTTAARTAPPADDAAATAPTGDRMERTAASTAPAAAAAGNRRGTIVKVIDSRFGRVLADGSGEAFYLFDKEDRPRSECYGACAAAWPPVLARGVPRAGRGAAASRLGTTRRRDGKRQVTYAGRPLYYYVGDAPGTIRCHDVFEYGGSWLVVKPDGRPVA